MDYRVEQAYDLQKMNLTACLSPSAFLTPDAVQWVKRVAAKVGRNQSFAQEVLRVKKL